MSLVGFYRAGDWTARIGFHVIQLWFSSFIILLVIAWRGEDVKFSLSLLHELDSARD